MEKEEELLQAPSREVVAAGSETNKSTKKRSLQVDGATKVRTALRFYAKMFLTVEEWAVLEILIQCEEFSSQGEYEGVTQKQVASILQVEPEAVAKVLENLVRVQLALAIQSPLREQLRARSSMVAKLQRSLKYYQKKSKAQLELDGEEGAESDGATSSEDEKLKSLEAGLAAAEEEALDAEQLAPKYILNYRTALPWCLYHFRSVFAKVCSTKVPLEEYLTRVGRGGAEGAVPSSSSTLTAQTQSVRGQQRYVRCIFCVRCSTLNDISGLRQGALCTLCNADLITLVLLAAEAQRIMDEHERAEQEKEAKAGQPRPKTTSLASASDAQNDFFAPEKPSGLHKETGLVIPRALLSDKALLYEGLTWAALFSEVFVTLQDPGAPITHAADLMTKEELRLSASRATSSISLKYRTVPRIPVQIKTLYKKEEDQQRRIEVKRKRQTALPPWFMPPTQSNGSSGVEQHGVGGESKSDPLSKKPRLEQSLWYEPSTSGGMTGNSEHQGYARLAAWHLLPTGSTHGCGAEEMDEVWERVC